MSKLAEKLKAIRERASTESTTNVISISPQVTTDVAVVTEGSREAQADQTALILFVDQIEVGEQARKEFRGIEELATSIKDKGQLQPVVVREIAPQRYKLLAGERRLRACRLLRQDTIKAIVLADIEDELEWRLLQLTENLQREDYAPLELAMELSALKDRFSFSDAELASRLQLSRTWVWKQLSLLEAPAHIREAIEAGRLAATDYLNNKSMYLAKAQDSSNGANNASDEGSGVRAPSPSTASAVERIPTVQVPLPAAMEIAALFSSLADMYGSNPVSINKKPTKKELIALLTSRASELHRLVKRNALTT